MSNILVTIEQDAWNDLKTAVNAVESGLKTVEQDAATDVGILWSDLKIIISTDAQTLYNDYQSDLQQIAVNLQNTQPGIDLENFIPAFIAAVIPVAEKEGLKLLQTDWNIIANSFAGKLNIPTTPGNAGVVS